MIDGADNNERLMGTAGVRVSIDAVAEVKIQTNLYAARPGAPTAASSTSSPSPARTNCPAAHSTTCVVDVSIHAPTSRPSTRIGNRISSGAALEDR
jgi:hypothetical protein